MRSSRMLALAVAGVAVLGALTVHTVLRADTARADDHVQAAGATAHPSTAAPARSLAPSSPAASAPSSAVSTSAPPPPPSPAAVATARLTTLTAGLAPGSVSVAVYAPATGERFSYGAPSGMITASVAKVQILETLLLQAHANGALLTGDEDSEATAMIENSDNDAAQDLYDDDGDTDGILAADPQLGISPTTTVPGPDYEWGLTTTCATDQVRLLTNLVSPSSPLDAAEQAYALNLMQNVESDQRWGAPVVADPGTVFAVKNGWLSVDNDNGLWAVNSDAIVTVSGKQVLISVLTQHDGSEQDGIDLVQSLAQAAVGAVS